MRTNIIFIPALIAFIMAHTVNIQAQPDTYVSEIES